MAEAFPLAWPEGWKVTDNWRRRKATFKTTFASSRDGLVKQLKHMGAKNIVLSSNIPLKRDGSPYAGQSSPKEPGIAVYFTKWNDVERKDKQMVLACDKWDKVEHNLRALEKTVEAMRGIDRWGASQILERAFMGFDALPPGPKPHAPPPAPPPPRGKDMWWLTLGVSAHASVEDCRQAWKTLARKYHPDLNHGASSDLMARINAAMQERERLG